MGMPGNQHRWLTSGHADRNQGRSGPRCGRTTLAISLDAAATLAPVGVRMTRSARRPPARRGGISAILGVLLVVGLLSCRRDEPAASSATATTTTTTDCELRDVSERATTSTLDDLDDPIAKLVLRQGCPTEFAAVQAKLAQVDAQGCDGDLFAADRTTLVSEVAQLRGAADGSLDECTAEPSAIYRGIVQRTCGDRQPWELMLSVVPFATSISDLPDNLEAMGWDRTRREFNFYTLEEGKWLFHGSSRDMLRGMGEDGQRRCAACHVGGGLVMKELDNPWPFWEGRLTTAGVDDVLKMHPALGSRTQGKVIDFRPAGKELEDAIVDGNAAWSATRVQHQREHGTLQSLLRPLFCTEELNLAAATETASPPWQTAAEAGAGALEPDPTLLVHGRLAVDVKLSLPLAAYHAALREHDQHVQAPCGKRMVDGQGRPVVDAPFDLIHPRRGRADDQHVDALVEAGLLDDDTVRAVLAVDFARPIFSTARCELLDAVPDVPAAERTAATVRAAIAVAATGEGAAAAELARNLDDPRSIEPRVRHFLTTCAARDGEDFTRDVVAWVSELRKRARERHVLEFEETLPFDALPSRPSLHWQPGTCTLTDDAAAEPTPASD